MGFADDNKAGIGMTLQNIREQCTGRLTRGVSVNDVDLSFGRFEIDAPLPISLFRTAQSFRSIVD